MIPFIMPPLDISEFAEDFGQADPAKEARLEARLEKAAWRAANEAKEFWHAEAARNLKSTREKYQRAIYVYDSFEDGISVGLDKSDPLVKAIEDGSPKFDMKKNMTGSRVVPVTKNPVVFRTMSRDQGNGTFEHPGWDGLHLEKIVEKELEDRILPKYLREALQDEGV